MPFSTLFRGQRWPVHAFACALASLLLPGTAHAEVLPWIEKSNLNARVLLDATNRFSPETASSLGFAEFDDSIVDLSPDVDERLAAALVEAKSELKQRLLGETDALVRQDLEILIESANNQLESNRLAEKHLLPFVDIGRLIFGGESDLLDEQVVATRKKAALVRLQKYAGLTDGATPLTELAKARYKEAAAEEPARLTPFKDVVQKAIANTDRYTTGIRELFVEYGLDQQPGFAEAMAALERQLKAYNEWLQTMVLPEARTDYRLPAELYADNLKNVGLDIAPEELIQRALFAFAEIRTEMQALAPLVSRENNLPVSDYRAVIQALKKEQLARESVENFYGETIAKIEQIIRRERIVTLPENAMIMRVASEAETAASPAPHLQTPPLFNNTGERGAFILTTGNPTSDAKDKTSYDDFTYRAAAWTLTAHEGRPGHELQFAAMVERGVSLARSIFAFNSVNVEGWALYAEAEMKPYEPLDGQLVTLQFRLLRAARAFLDPMLNLGMITRERAFEILTQDVVLSEAMAQQEVDRYTFRAPGQATAYFYGYLRFLELRATTEITLGAKFDRLAFHDFVIGEGLLPPTLLAQAVREKFIPSQAKK